MNKIGFYFISILLLMPLILLGQPGGPGGDPSSPLDGGLLTVLIGSAATYLGLRYHKKQKKQGE